MLDAIKTTCGLKIGLTLVHDPCTWWGAAQGGFVPDHSGHHPHDYVASHAPNFVWSELEQAPMTTLDNKLQKMQFGWIVHASYCRHVIWLHFCMFGWSHFTSCVWENLCSLSFPAPPYLRRDTVLCLCEQYSAVCVMTWRNIAIVLHVWKGAASCVLGCLGNVQYKIHACKDNAGHSTVVLSYFASDIYTIEVSVYSSGCSCTHRSRHGCEDRV